MAPVARADEPQRPAPPGLGKTLLLVARLQALPFGKNPDLQQMNEVGRRGIELAVFDSGKAEIVLGFGVPLLGGLAVPLHRLGVVLGDASALGTLHSAGRRPEEATTGLTWA